MSRSVSYQAEDVLRRAADLFRFRPFHAVSVQEIVEATGINRFAMYERFGSKEGLFYACLEHYLTRAIKGELLSAFSGESGTFDDLIALLQQLRRLNLDPQMPAGCLIMNARLELGGSDVRVERIVEDYLSTLRSAVERALAHAGALGELREGRSVQARAEYVVTLLNAFMVLAHVSRASADTLIGAVIEDVASWRIGTPSLN